MHDRQCLNCDKKYKHEDGTKYSKERKEYVKYLGCCCEDCFLQQPRKNRNRLMIGAFLRELQKQEK